MATVPIFSPDGSLGDVPENQLVAAVRAGAKPGIHITAPNGLPGVIPADRVSDAISAGAKIVPIENQPIQHPGFWAAFGSDLGGMAKGAFNTMGAAMRSVATGNPQPLMDQAGQVAQTISENIQHRREEGRSLPYRTIAPLGDVLGVNTRGMEDAADQGDMAGVAGHMATPIALTAAGAALAHGIPAAADALDTPAGKAVTAGAKAAAGKLPVAAIRRIPYVGDVAGDVYDAARNAAREANEPEPEPELDATAENKSYAGAPKPKLEKELDATGENKPFLGGMDEALPPKKSVQSAASPRTIVLDPESGQPEFSDVVAAKQNAAPIVSQSNPTAAASMAEVQSPASGTLASRLSQLLEKAQNEPRVPEPEEDLTALLQQSLDQVKAKPGGVMTTADPAQLAKRWGVDQESLSSGREQTRGMSPEQTEQFLDGLADSYRKGRPVEPVMETRDEANNVIDADGRARVMAAQRAGIERIPVMIRRIAKPVAPSLGPESAGSTR
jgi:hypothetical protein